MPAKLRVTLIKSTISHTARTRATVRSLGLHRLGDTVEVDDTPEMRGMTRAVRFLLQTDVVDEATPVSAEPDAVPAKAPARSKKTTEEASQ